MDHRRTAALLGLALAVLIAAPVGLPAAAKKANRGLERVYEKNRYASQDTRVITQAFDVAVDAGVQERDALRLVESCAEGKFSPEQISRVLTLAAQIALDRLPDDLFVSKVLEGVAKGVDADLVVKAAERRARETRLALNLVRGLALDGVSVRDRDELVPDIAEALAAGMDEGRIRAIITEAVEAGDDIGAIRRKLFP
jgi:hypothetical protein